MSNSKTKIKPIINLPKPLDYQRDILQWLEEPDTKIVTFNKGRQSGGSFLLKMLVTKWGLEDTSNKIGFITPTSKLSKLFYSELIESLKPLIKENNSTDLVIKFITGSKLQFFSAESEDSLRGFQFTHLVIDEAAYIKDDTFNFIIRPTYLIKGKKIVLCSTPSGNNGFFYNFYNYGLDNVPGYKTKSINIYDNPYLSNNEIELIKSQVPDRVWRQEYLGEFLDGNGTVFTNFRNCINNKPTLTGNYYAGIDWGKTDSTVLTIMNDLKQVVEIYRINELEYTTQVKLITSKLNQWKPKITISEENNIGQVVNELLKEQYKGQIRRVTLDNTEKKNNIENLMVGFEQGDISILENDVLLRELQSFTATYNHQTKSVKYSAPNGLHDDTVISLSYAYSLIKTKKGSYTLT